MKPPAFAFAGPPLNRHANERGKSLAFRDLASGHPTACVQCRGDLVLMEKNLLSHSFPGDGRDLILLGEDTSGCFWAAARADDGEALVPVRSLMVSGSLDAASLSIIAQAKSLLHWHHTHGFCAACGAATTLADLGYRRHCAGCGADHFPRTDPVVIMAVRCGSRLLLGRQKSWSAGMYSALAGFMEPGETMEAAVAREVYEEVGVSVTSVRYITTQPWPFPSSLMIGVIAEAAAEALVIDHNELETARWFGIDELNLMLTDQHPEGLTASHPYAIAHAIVKEAAAEMQLASGTGFSALP